MLGTGFPSASQFNLITESFLVSILPPDDTDLILDGTVKQTVNVKSYFTIKTLDTERFFVKFKYILFRSIVYKRSLCHDTFNINGVLLA